jgi:hypothetical protein
MKRLKIAGIGGIVVALAAVGLIALTFFANPLAADRESEDTVADKSGTDEGIKVHGDWVIEVKNPDGSLAERREFTNDLQQGGKVFLRNTLARQASPGVWGIRLPATVGSSPCGATEEFCVIREPISSGMDSLFGVHFPTLSILTPGGPPIEIVLQGNFDAVTDGSIGTVQSIQCFTQPPSLDPSTCNNIGHIITETNLQAPVDVLAGQQVLVTVRISFS